MIALAVALLAVGVLLLVGQAKALALLAAIRTRLPAVGVSQVIGVGVVLIAVAILAAHTMTDAEPTPAPGPTVPLDLHGKFTGPTAAEDAAILGGICGELAEIIEHDGSEKGGRRFKTAVQIDEWRRAMREFRCRGDSVGARQPAARDAIGDFMTNTVGDSPAALTPEMRSAWVGALRDVARACNDTVR
jgi:hypothetical protein